MSMTPQPSADRPAPLDDEPKHQTPAPPDALPLGPDGGAMARGVSVIEAQLRTLGNQPGVYRMLNPAGDALYVGKARNLRKRVAAYTQLGQLPNRLQRLVDETAAKAVLRH